MPSAENGREKVLEYLEENNIQDVSIATMYGMTKQDVGAYLRGKLKETPAANKLILAIISDFKIR